LKANHNYMDRLSETLFFALATCRHVNGEKEYPFWVGLTDHEKHGKRFRKQRANFYRRMTKERRDLKAFAQRIAGDPELRTRLRSRMPKEAFYYNDK
jgi:hypothetical protein